MSAALSITKFLTSPTRVAHALDWKKAVSGCTTASVLSLHVGKDCIDLAVTGLGHPSSSSSLSLDSMCVQPLPSIPLKKTTCQVSSNNKSCFKTSTLHPSVAQELHDLVKDWNVCGFVVSWPVQKEGRCGAQCGRVLHTLDQIVAADLNNSSLNSSLNSSMFNFSRPVCLWDSNHVPAMREDEWGRSVTYAGRTTMTAPADTARNNSNNSHKPNKPMIHYASVEQYQDDGAVAAEIAADYMRHFFPEHHHHHHHHHQDYSDILIPSSTTSSPAAAAVVRAVKKATMTTSIAKTTAASTLVASPQSFDMAWLEDAPPA
jgi:hypothetical protein